ncbi:MAG: nucleotidyltransferase family protein [Ruminococcaceae bacterium]|nr:nucleotidyltransferase family protein [Oscillospiraceae bacterium]
MKQKIGCVLMAAGDSKRFGENKLNRKVDGTSLIDRALRNIPKEKLYKVVVVSQYDEVIKKAQSLGFSGIKNAHPDFGISHTIKLGLDDVCDCDATMFMVSDQPLLKKESVSQMLDFFEQNNQYIVGMGYGGVRGNPCVFPRKYYDELRKLEEDHGGSTVIRMHEDELLLFEANHPDELSDIDTKADLQKLCNTEVKNG